MGRPMALDGPEAAGKGVRRLRREKGIIRQKSAERRGSEGERVSFSGRVSAEGQRRWRQAAEGGDFSVRVPGCGGGEAGGRKARKGKGDSEEEGANVLLEGSSLEGYSKEFATV